MADKLSDKISVVIAPPSTDGRFFAANLIGGTPNGAAPPAPEAADAVDASATSAEAR